MYMATPPATAEKKNITNRVVKRINSIIAIYEVQKLGWRQLLVEDAV
jgi:hypothetical protein